MQNIPLDLFFLVGGMFLYGIKSIVGKWMVTYLFIKPMKKLLLKTEKDVTHYLYMRNKAYQRHVEKQSER